MNGLNLPAEALPAPLPADPKPGAKSTEVWIIAGCIFFILTAGTALLVYGKITSAQWIDVAKFVPTFLASVLMAGRSGIKIIHALKQGPVAPAPPK